MRRGLSSGEQSPVHHQGRPLLLRLWHPAFPRVSRAVCHRFEEDGFRAFPSRGRRRISGLLARRAGRWWSGIRNDPNDWAREHAQPHCIVDLIKRVNSTVAKLICFSMRLSISFIAVAPLFYRGFRVIQRFPRRGLRSRAHMEDSFCPIARCGFRLPREPLGIVPLRGRKFCYWKAWFRLLRVRIGAPVAPGEPQSCHRTLCRHPSPTQKYQRKARHPHQTKNRRLRSSLPLQASLNLMQFPCDRSPAALTHRCIRLRNT